MVHWWGKNQVAEKCRSAILTTYETDLRTRYRYIYTDLCLLMLTYLTYADHTLIIARNLAGFCGN
jgi:hypothetical protein